ncbi:hypothetical protein U9M48_038566 [Paspalum notatum var. saurae]|uniref:Uncharacterized protein n=1 Tax=Paspalum notatum var. saurae TaxID=547442 RepID=A0AAQ3UIT8_PASNO
MNSLVNDIRRSRQRPKPLEAVPKRAIAAENKECSTMKASSQVPAEPAWSNQEIWALGTCLTQSAAEEVADDLVLRDGLVAGRLEEVEGVALAGRLPDLGVAGPAAGPEAVVVCAAAVAEHVALADADEHAAARQGRQRRRGVHEGVDERVVHARGGGAHDAPEGAEALALGGVEVVGGHGVGAQEVGVDHDEPPDMGAVGQALRGDAHRHVVRDVGARALAAQVEAGEVGVARDPRVPGGRATVGGASEVGDDPGERVPGVGVGGGDGVLGGEAVLDGDDEDAGERGEGVEVGVESGVEGGTDAEAAAVVVDNDGELGAGVGEAREVEARGDVGGDDHVPGGDARGGVRGRGDELGAEVALHAVLVDADEGHGLVDDLVVRGGRRRGDGRGGGHRRSGLLALGGQRTGGNGRVWQRFACFGPHHHQSTTPPHQQSCKLIAVWSIICISTYGSISFRRCLTAQRTAYNKYTYTLLRQQPGQHPAVLLAAGDQRDQELSGSRRWNSWSAGAESSAQLGGGGGPPARQQHVVARPAGLPSPASTSSATHTSTRRHPSHPRLGAPSANGLTHGSRPGPAVRPPHANAHISASLPRTHACFAAVSGSPGGDGNRKNGCSSAIPCTRAPPPAPGGRSPGSEPARRARLCATFLPALNPRTNTRAASPWSRTQGSVSTPAAVAHRSVAQASS